jgi:esterase
VTVPADLADAHEFEPMVDVADEIGVSRDRIPPLERRTIEVGAGQQLSAIVWGPGAPEIIFLHGGGQNAHTWDLVALGLGRPALALDLPGHGHSSWREDHNYGPAENALAVASAIEQVAPTGTPVVGMSMGGLTTIRLAGTRPDLVSRAVIVDASPGVHRQLETMTTEQWGAVALTRGPRTYATREEMVEAATSASPRRPASAVRRGVIHNTRQLPDGTWTWRYDVSSGSPGLDTYKVLWDDVSAIKAPTMLVRGGDSVFVSDDDVAEFARRQPSTRLEDVAGAGHSVQSDQPKALTALLADFIS